MSNSAANYYENGENSERRSVPIIQLRRFRNFRFSIPFQTYVDKRANILEFANTRCKFFYLQEEMSERGHHHCEVFLHTGNNMSVRALNNALGIQYSWGVSAADVDREFDYCSKETTRVADGIILSIGTPPKKLPQSKDLYRQLLAFDNPDDGMEYLKEKDPQTYVLQRQKIESCLIRESRKTVSAKYSKFNVPLINVRDGKAHVFVGSTGIGKTNYALSHFKKAILCSDRQDFGKIGASTDGLVIDDMTFKSWLPTNLLHIVDVDFDRSVNVKYGVSTIPAGMPRIICVNDLNLFWPQDCLPATQAAIGRRIVIHDFGSNKLFDDDKISISSQNTLVTSPAAPPIIPTPRLACRRPATRRPIDDADDVDEDGETAITPPKRLQIDVAPVNHVSKIEDILVTPPVYEFKEMIIPSTDSNTCHDNCGHRSPTIPQSPVYEDISEDTEMPPWHQNAEPIDISSTTITGGNNNNNGTDDSSGSGMIVDVDTHNRNVDLDEDGWPHLSLPADYFENVINVN